MSWSFLTNHAGVLLAVAQDPTRRVRDIAAEVGITERAAHKIVADLARDGYLTRTRVGIRTIYDVHPERPLPWPQARGRAVGALLAVFIDQDAATADGSPTAKRPARA